MKHITTGILALLLLGVVVAGAPNAYAETTASTVSSSMLDQIKLLMEKVAELQKQLATIRGEIKEVIRSGVSEGMTGDDVTKIQELLATDSSIYPEGKVTGFFGPLTREAIKRFQTRHELEVTGVIDEDTRALLEEYLHEGFGDNIPQGLLHAPGIMKKIELRIAEGCENKGHGKGPLCKKLRVKYESEIEDDTEDEDEDDSDEEESEDDSFDVEIEIEDDATVVHFTFDGVEYESDVDSTDETDVLEAVADELDVNVDELDEDLEQAIKDELADEIADDSDNEEDVDEDEDDSDEAMATDAIEAAQDAIEAAQDAIDESDEDTATAAELLEDAKDKLEEAEGAFDDEEFEDAEELADEAKELAEDAEDAL